MQFHGKRGNCFWIVLYEKGIEVDNTKIKSIEKMYPPSLGKEVRSLLRHA